MVVRVQQQQGTVDYGLFAIAYAVSLANGKDPAKIQDTFSGGTLFIPYIHVTIGNKQCRDTLNDPYSIEETNFFFSVKLYAPAGKYAF